jgi:hypothetical protein
MLLLKNHEDFGFVRPHKKIAGSMEPAMWKFKTG